MNLSESEWERLERYVSRRGTAEELAELARWIDGNVELRALADGMRTAGQVVGESRQPWDADAAWRGVSRRMRWFARPPLGTNAGRGRVSWLHWAAAAVVLLAGSSSLLLIGREHGSQNAAVRPAPARQVVTRRGERASFNLADGSRVMLGAESRLRIPADYNTSAAGGRRLLLEGEAYFVVRHDSTRPFLVQTATGIAEDLGTEFVVTDYPETRGMQVVVASGAVALRRPALQDAGMAAPVDTSPLLTLREGELALLDTLGVATLTRGADIRPYLAWTEGALVFRGTRLGDVLPRIGRWYDLDIRLADSALAGRRLTATFRNEAAPQVLRLLALSLDLSVAQQGRTVTLSSRSRGPVSP